MEKAIIYTACILGSAHALKDNLQSDTKKNWKIKKKQTQQTNKQKQHTKKNGTKTKPIEYKYFEYGFISRNIRKLTAR